jgi:hypothetical protein
MPPPLRPTKRSEFRGPVVLDVVAAEQVECSPGHDLPDGHPPHRRGGHALRGLGGDGDGSSACLTAGDLDRDIRLPASGLGMDSEGGRDGVSPLQPYPVLRVQGPFRR